MTDPGRVERENHESWVVLLGAAANEVFERMLGSQLASRPEPHPDREFDVTSMVGLAGKISGVMTLSCPVKCAALMASRMLGVDVHEAGPEIWDAVGEVCNMIAGNFKNKIAGLGDGCMLSVPTVITGVSYDLHPLVDSAQTEVQLLFEGLPLTVSIAVHS